MADHRYHNQNHNPDQSRLGNLPAYLGKGFCLDMESFGSKTGAGNLGLVNEEDSIRRGVAQGGNPQLQAAFFLLTHPAICGFSYTESSEVLRYFSRPDGVGRLSRALEKAASRTDGRWQSSLRELEAALESHEAWLREGKTNKNLQRLLASGMFDREIASAESQPNGATQESPPAKDDNESLRSGLPRWRSLLPSLQSPVPLSQTISLVDILLPDIVALHRRWVDGKEAEQIQRTDLRELLSHLRGLTSAGAADLAQRYASDFVVHAMAESALSNCRVQLDGTEARVALPGYRDSGIGPGAETVMSVLRPVYAEYVALADEDEGARALLLALPTASIPLRAVAAARASAGFFQQDALKIRPADVARLLRAAPLEDRNTFLDLLIEHPELIRLNKAVHRHGLTEPALLAFALEFDGVHILRQGQTCSVLEFLLNLASEPSRAPVAAFLMGQGKDLWHDRRLAGVLDIASKHGEAKLLIEDYFIPWKLGQQNKSLLVLLLAHSNFQASVHQVKTWRSKLATCREEDLTWVREMRSPSEAARRFLGTYQAPVATAVQPLPAEDNSHMQDWFSERLEALANSAEPVVDRTHVQRAHDKLASISNHLPRRLLKVWQQAPEQLRVFCDHVLLFGDSQEYRRILANTSYFESYLDRLAQDPSFCSSRLRLLVQLGERGQKYLRRWLEPASAEMPGPPPKETLPKNGAAPGNELPAEAASPVKKLRYQRVLVFTNPDEMKGERWQRIASSQPGLEMVLAGDRIDYNMIKNLGSDTLIVLLTRAMSHRLYDAVKRACENTGAGILHIHKIGIEPIITELSLALRA